MRPEKLETGQKYLNGRGGEVTIHGKIDTIHASIQKLGSTFSINSTHGWFYGDGPMIGKWVLSSRQLVEVEKYDEDLILPDFVEPSFQLSLFD
jgi:hypothetical protein